MTMDIHAFYYFKEDRDYIHSSSIFDSILSVIKSRHPKQIDFSLSAKSSSGWALAKEEERGSSRPVIGQYKDEGVNFIILETDRVVNERRAYDESGLAQRFTIEDEKITVPDSIEEYSFIEKVNAAFKALLSKNIFPNDAIRYLFVRLLIDYIPVHDFSIQYRRKIGGKFYEGEISEEKGKIGFIYFSGEHAS